MKISKGTPCGAQIETENVKDNGELVFEMGTVGCPAWHDSHGSVMLTAAHVVDDKYQGVDRDVYNPDHPDSLASSGSTEHANTLNSQFTSQSTNCGDRTNDSAIVKFDDGHSYKFAADDGSYNNGWEVYGVLGWDSIKDGISLTKQGAYSGVHSGSTTCVDSNYYTFETNSYSEGGDSGRPRFTETYYEYPTSFKSMAGLTSYGVEGGGNLTGGPYIGNEESAMSVTI